MLSLLLACSPAVHPVTMAAVVQQESGGDPLVIHDNTSGAVHRPGSQSEAIALASRLVAAGHSIDLGLAQINSRNLPRLGMTIEQAFDPCKNLAAGETILREGWERSGDLKAALSAYNTGRPDSPVGQRYAAGVYRQAGVVVPAIPGGKLAGWVEKPAAVSLPPVRLEVRPAPAASRLAPSGGQGFSPAGWW